MGLVFFAVPQLHFPVTRFTESLNTSKAISGSEDKHMNIKIVNEQITQKKLLTQSKREAWAEDIGNQILEHAHDDDYMAVRATYWQLYAKSQCKNEELKEKVNDKLTEMGF